MNTTANSTSWTLAAADSYMARVIADPATSDWLKAALRSALERDALDAAADAETLATLLGARVNALLG